jgi:DNA-binding CsgD family transcriptional regulator
MTCENLVGASLDVPEHITLLRGAALDAAVPRTRGESTLFWRDLCRGSKRFADAFCDKDRCVCIAERVTAPAQPALSGVALAIIERLLAGESQKVVAMDLDLSISSVAGTMKRGLQAIGVPGGVSRLPLILFWMIHSASVEGDDGGVVGLFSHAGRDYAVFVARMPDAELRTRLSTAELEVARLLVEGCTHAQIAARRHASPRTAANQLSSVFRKFGVSGRSALLRAMVAGRHANDTQSRQA